MPTNKWGESFLKSGLPLEHTAALALRSARWFVRSNIEYQRELNNADAPWFELDMFATSSQANNGSSISMLAECKYHDTSRFWMFLPTEASSYGSTDDTLLNMGPLRTMRRATSKTLIELAPTSSVGVVLSLDGQKQDNAIHTGMQQLAHAFAPFALPEMLEFLDVFEFSEGDDDAPLATAVIPALVTNASLFRLRPEVRDLEAIRKAKAPEDVADSVQWTWCRVDISNPRIASNNRFFQQLRLNEQERFARFPKVAARLRTLLRSPRWFAVINVAALADVAGILHAAFMELELRNAFEQLKLADQGKQEASPPESSPAD